MRRIKTYIPVLSLLLFLVGCDYNDKYFDGLEELTQITDVKKLDYTLTAADYATIASNSTNKALATENGASAELAALSTTQMFTETLPAAVYVPAFLANQYTAADNSSAIKVTYNKEVGYEEYLTQLNTTELYVLNASDYQAAWGSSSDLNFFTPSEPAASYLPAILNNAIDAPEAGDIVMTTYNVSDNEPADITVAFSEDFEDQIARDPITSTKWTNVNLVGSLAWQTRLYSGNLYAYQSAYDTGGELDSYLISQEINIVNGMSLSFEATYAYYVAAGGRLSVLITKDLTSLDATGVNAATWVDITDQFTIETPSGSGTLTDVGSYDLTDYVGTDIRIAFRYQGDATGNSTIWLDNVAISTPGKNTYTTANALYTYTGTAWATYSGNNVVVLSAADFTEMGNSNDNFSSSFSADVYLPIYLKVKYPFAQEGDVKAPVYKYYANSVTSVKADEYTFDGNDWVKNNGVEAITEQFVKSNGTWTFDPSLVINIMPEKSNAESLLYTQAILDYVKTTYGEEYLDSYGTAEYYCGTSTYYNNFDFRASKWRTGCPAGATAYADLSDEELVELMYERLQEGLKAALVANHSDMAPIDGVEVTCTVNIGVYTSGTITDCNYTLKFKVVGKGQFEYIEDSSQPL